MTFRTSVGGEEKTTTIRAAGNSPLKVLDLQYRCELPPTTFCPLTESIRTKGGLRLRLKGTATPVVFLVPLADGEQPPQPRLIPLGLPARDAAVNATALLRVVGGTAKPAVPEEQIAAEAGDTIQALIRPMAKSPAAGRLRIAIPRTAGESLRVEAGGTSTKPYSTAKINVKGGGLRIVSVVWTCHVLSASFCPIGTINRTETGLTLALVTPRVPVVLILTTAKG